MNPIKVGPDLAAVASDIRKGKVAPELAGIDAMVRDLVGGAQAEAIQNIKLRGIIERAQAILAANLSPSDRLHDSTAIYLLHALLDGPDTLEAMGEAP